MTKFLKVACCVAALVPLHAQSWAEEPAQLVPFRFLVGEWEGVGGGGPGGGGGRAVFSRALQDRVLLRTSYAEYPAQGGRPAIRHDDLMVIYVDADSAVKADYYDNEGHVIRYSAHSPAGGQAVFLSQLLAAVPRYRLTYRLAADGTVGGEFEIAPPGKPEEFRSYLKWTTQRVGRERAK
jgi:hypothetical protein